MRKVAAMTAIVVGIIMAIAGVVTWYVISSTLEDQRITVSDDANCAAGDNVNGPISAFCQADIIDHHTQAITMRTIAFTGRYKLNGFYTRFFQPRHVGGYKLPSQPRAYGVRIR